MYMYEKPKKASLLYTFFFSFVCFDEKITKFNHFFGGIYIWCVDLKKNCFFFVKKIITKNIGSLMDSGRWMFYKKKVQKKFTFNNKKYNELIWVGSPSPPWWF